MKPASSLIPAIHQCTKTYRDLQPLSTRIKPTASAFDVLGTLPPGKLAASVFAVMVLGGALAASTAQVRASTIDVGVNTNGDCTFACTEEYQQVYASSVFSGPVDITSVSFIAEGGLSWNGSTWEMSLSQSANAVGALSSNFASNIGANSTAFDTQTFTGTVAAGGLITFTGNFDYNPTLGPLLVTIQLVGGSTANMPVEAGDDPNLYSRAYAFNSFTTAEGVNDGPYYGDVTLFGVAATPPPRRPSTLRHRTRPIRFARLAQEAEGPCGGLKSEFVLGDDDVVRLLRVAIEREGGQVAFAKHHSVNRTYLNMVLHRKRPVGDAVAEALGLHKVYTLK